MGCTISKHQYTDITLYPAKTSMPPIPSTPFIRLLDKRNQLDALMQTYKKHTITKGEITMSYKEKFKDFTQQLIDDNETKYGEEIRKKFSNEIVDASNAKIKGMTQEDYAKVEALSAEVNEALKIAFEQGDPASELAQKACELHKKWLCYFWDSYTKEAHIGIAQMYVDDPRFTAYYDKIADGCAVFLRDAILVYCS